MAEHDHDDAWTRRIRSRLDDSTRDLDAATLSRLNRARQAALAQTTNRSRSWLPLAALGSACALAVAIALWPQPPSPPATAATTADDFPMLAGDDALELYEELDFYAWLDAQPASG